MHPTEEVNLQQDPSIVGVSHQCSQGKGVAEQLAMSEVPAAALEEGRRHQKPELYAKAREITAARIKKRRFEKQAAAKLDA